MSPTDFNRRAFRLTVLVLSTLASLGCERPPNADVPEVPVVETTIADTVALAPAFATTWDQNAGPVLLVRDGPTRALLVFPQPADDTDPPAFRPEVESAIRGARVDVFTRGGRPGTARIGSISPVSPESDCPVWPQAQLEPTGDALPLQWTIGFLSGRADPLPLDSLGSFSTADSTRVVAALARVASALPDPPNSVFRGLPFTVRSAFRATMPNGREVLLADLVRRLGQEAEPLHEHTFLVTERDTTATDARHSLAFHEKTVGHEERVLTSEMLGAFSLRGSNRVNAILQRQTDETIVFGFLEREREGRWRLRWTSLARHLC